MNAELVPGTEGTLTLGMRTLFGTSWDLTVDSQGRKVSGPEKVLEDDRLLGITKREGPSWREPVIVDVPLAELTRENAVGGRLVFEDTSFHTRVVPLDRVTDVSIPEPVTFDTATELSIDVQEPVVVPVDFVNRLIAANESVPRESAAAAFLVETDREFVADLYRSGHVRATDEGGLVIDWPSAQRASVEEHVPARTRSAVSFASEIAQPSGEYSMVTRRGWMTSMAESDLQRLAAAEAYVREQVPLVGHPARPQSPDGQASAKTPAREAASAPVIEPIVVQDSVRSALEDMGGGTAWQPQPPVELSLGGV